MRRTAQEDTSMHFTHDAKQPLEILNKDYIQEVSFSTGKLPKKLSMRKGSRSKSKIQAMVSKEYKEDLIDGYDIIKSKIGHSNSFETKIKILHTLPPPNNGNRNFELI